MHDESHLDAHALVSHQFDDLGQQKDAATLGMWAFLATEVMFFGGALLAYGIYRHAYPDAFAAASATENWFIGALNTGVLLCSSFTVVLAVHSAQEGNTRGIIKYLYWTIGLTCIFLAVKTYEYVHIISANHAPWLSDELFHVEPLAGVTVIDPVRFEGAAKLFFSFYFALTGIHALHMLIGVGVMLFVIHMAKNGKFNRHYYNPVEVTGLYWHFVDIVWIFLYPLLYLIAPQISGGH